MPIAFGRAQPSLNPIPAHQLLVALRNGPFDDHTTFVVDAPGVPPQPGHWTDLSAYWDLADPKRGRQQQTGYFEAGTLTAHLRNYNGEFNTFGQSGLFTPYLDLGRPVQHRVTVGGTTYYRFTGFLTSIKPLWPDVMTVDVELLASDLFRFLNLSPLGNKKYSAAVVGAGPTNFWRCNDPNATNGAVSSCADTMGGTPITVHSGTSGALATTGGPGVTLLDGAGSALNFGGYQSNGGQAYTTCVSVGAGPYTWMGWASGLTQGNYASIVYCLGPNQIWSIQLGSSAPYLTFAVYKGDGTGIQSRTGGVIVVDGHPHMIEVKYDGATFKFYVDTVLEATIAYTTTGGPLYLGGAPTPPAAAGVPNTTSVDYSWGGIALSEVALFNFVTSAAQSSSIYGAAVGFAQQFTDYRVAAVLAAVGLPASINQLDPGVQLCQQNTQNLVKVRALAHLEQVEQTEEGALFMTGRGLVRFVARDQLATAAPYATIQATFGDRVNRAATPGGAWGSATWGASTWGAAATTGIIDIPYQPGVDIGLDDLNVINQPDVTRVGGATQTYYGTNQAGPHGLSRSNVLHNSDACSLQHAKWLLDKYSASRTELRKITVELTDFLDDPVMLGRVLQLDLLHRVEVRRDQVGFRQVGLIEHIDEHVDARAGRWSITFSIAVADTYPTWQWAGSPQ